MKKKPAVFHHNHMVEKILRITGAVVIAAILVYQLLFYYFLGYAYIPTLEHLIATIVVMIILIYSYYLVLTIRSVGKLVVVFVLCITTILISAVLLYVFTPLVDFAASQFVNSMLCERIPSLYKSMPHETLETIQSACKQVSTKFLFGY